MQHKQDTPAQPHRLPGWEVLEATGTDANAFLQAQLMNDLRTLHTGHWQWNGWLNPKGRVIAIFALLAVGSDRYWLVSPDVAAAELAQRMQRLVFRSKVVLRVRDDIGAFALLCAEHPDAHELHSTVTMAAEFTHPYALNPDATARAPTQILRVDGSSAQFDEVISLDMGTAIENRWLQLKSVANAGVEGDHTAANRWQAFDIAHGLPRLSAAQSEQWTPQMLSLDRLNAYSLKKGCYPGQEIVARTHYLGQAKRELVRIIGNALTDNAQVSAEGRAIGTIVSFAGNEALAVLAVERPASGWECGGDACHKLPLLEGLAR